jgi:hypothetical protein
MDGLLAESWVQGSLSGGLRTLFQYGIFNRTNVLMISDVPNCDIYSNAPCATGSLGTDVSTWFGFIKGVGLNGTWTVWNYIDGSLSQANYYGDAWSNSTTAVTTKGLLHRVRAGLEADFGPRCYAFNSSAVNATVTSTTLATSTTSSSVVSAITSTATPTATATSLACDTQLLADPAAAGYSVLQCPTTLTSFFGITIQKTGQVGGVISLVTQNESGWTYFAIGTVPASIFLSSSSPNGIAYDANGRNLYFAGFTDANLYRFNVDTRNTTVAGSLVGQAGGAAFHSGAYWYGRQQSDELRRVILDQSGNVASDVLVTYLPGGAPSPVIHDYGDLDFSPDGLLYLAYAIFNTSTNVDVMRELSTYNLTSSQLQVLRSGPISWSNIS